MTTLLRILLVEDSPMDEKLLTAELRRHGRAVSVTRVETADAMREALTRDAWDLVISDWSMPQFSAPQALEVLNESGRDLPFVIVSGTVGEELAVEAMRAGAHDYIVKGKLARLPAVIDRELREAAMRSASRSAEAELLRQERRFREMIERSAEAITMTDAQGALTYVSPAMLRILGYELEDVIGRPILDIVHPDDRAVVLDSMLTLREQPGHSTLFEMRGLHQDGSVRWIEARATNLLADPQVRAVIGNLRDITEHRAMLERLRESEARYRRIIETTGEGVWIADAAGTITFANSRLAQMLDRTLDEVIGLAITRVLELEAVATAPHAQVEGTLRRRDGTTRHVLVDATPIVGDRGTNDGVLGMAMDVTERRNAEVRLERLSEAGIVGMCIADFDGRMTDANETYLRMVGYTRADLERGLTWADLTRLEDPAAEDARLFEHLQLRGKVEPYERELYRKDGSKVPVLIGIATLGGTEVISFVADLSAQKRAEAALRVSEAQLLQAQKMEAMGRLAGGVAHDFNNVLTVILSYVDLALESVPEGASLREDLEEMRKAGLRAADLTRQLLMFSRQQVIATQVIDVNALVHGIDRMLQRIVGEDISMVYSLANDLGRISADRGQIEQVLMNLIVNARDAMPRGGTIRLRTANRHLDAAFARDHHGVEPGPHVVIEVTDTGTGIPRETMTRIFEPFFTTKEKGKGTGLGLSTVFGIVQNSGGSVWVDSEVGVGTTFTILFPRVERQVSTVISTITPSMLIKGSETVLLVEDEAQVRTVAAQILRRRGYTVIETADPREALDVAARGGRIDLLITDVVMPGISGPELIRRITEMRPSLAVLCMSGYTDDSIVRHGMDEGNLAFLQKPLTPDSLIRKVREVLDTRRS